MIDVNVYLSEALLAGGITCPACEIPMRGDAPGPYITWEQRNLTDQYASGEIYMRQRLLLLNVYFPPDMPGWRQLQESVAYCLNNFRHYAPHMVSSAYGLSGALDVPAINRRRVQMMVTVREVPSDAWPLG